MTTAENNIDLLETVKLFNDKLVIEIKDKEVFKVLFDAAEKINGLIDTFVAANDPPQCMIFVKQHLEWFVTKDMALFPMVQLFQALDKLIALDKKTRIEVGRAPFGHHNGHAEWCAWLQHYNIHTTTEFNEKNEMVTYATPWMAKAVWGMQISQPARFGNCPAITKWLNVPMSEQTAYDTAFRDAFYAKGATWEQKVALNDAYMANQPINNINP